MYTHIECGVKIIRNNEFVEMEYESDDAVFASKSFKCDWLMWDILLAGGVVAGGAATYLLDNALTFDQVGDIDVFVLDNDVGIFKNILDLIYTHSQNFTPQYNREKSSVTVEYHGKKWKNIQVVLTTFSSPDQLIEAFDMDYVQCAFYQEDGMLRTLATRRAFDAHISHIIRDIGSEKLNARRLLKRLYKAYKKGYKLPDKYRKIDDLVKAGIVIDYIPGQGEEETREIPLPSVDSKLYESYGLHIENAKDCPIYKTPKDAMEIPLEPITTMVYSGNEIGNGKERIKL